jgi:uncharacterized membrane protein YhaH (DUF805 family)
MSEPTRMSLRDKMFSFDGRLRRADYWFISICLGVSTFVVTEVLIWNLFGRDYSLLSGHLLTASQLRVSAFWPVIVQMLLSGATLWPALAMSAKRAHDRNKSARLILALVVVVWANGFAQILLPNSAEAAEPLPIYLASLAWNVLMFAASVYLFVVVGCLDGTRGPNRFGPSPKADELPEPA